MAKTSLFTLSAMTLSLLSNSAFATVIGSSAYNDFPYKDPYQSTLVSELLKARDNFKSESGFLTGLQSDRSQVPYLVGQDKLYYNFHIVSADAPVIFILSGLGGSEASGISQFLADRLAEAGFSTINIASPYYWRFALVASQTGIPGIASSDDEEVYGEMQMVLNRLKATEHIQPKHLGFIGYSMGAFEGIKLAEIDRDVQALHIDTFLLINPPMDLNYGIKVLDGLYAQGLAMGTAKLQALSDKLFNVGETLLEESITTPGYFLNLTEKFSVTDPEAAFLISESLESCVSDLVMTSQSMHQTLPQSELEGPADAAHRQVREYQAGKMTLGQYMTELALPSFSQQIGFAVGSPEFNARLREETTLLTPTHLNTIRTDSRIQYMHNADDFITAPADLKTLEQTAPSSRITVYPYGGHVENVWYPENLQKVLGTFSPLKTN